MPYTPLSTANTIQSWRLRINDIDSVKVESLNPTSSGLWAHTGRATISTNLTVSGNVSVSGTANLGRIAQSTNGILLNVDDDLTTRLNCGFWQTSTATTAEGWPETTNQWYHLITSTHDNESNYYSMQLAADFYTQKLWYRSTNNLGTQSWGRVVHTNDTAINQQFNSLGVGTTATGTAGQIRNTSLISSDSNLGYRFDTANKRVLTNIYGFDFIDNGGIITPTNKTRYTYGSTGANQTLVVPAGVSYIFVKMWGAGGGGGSYGGWRQGSPGGAGGFSHGIIPVVPGETITIRVGGRGLAIPANASSYPDGGRASVSTGDNRYAGSGGGSSSILVPSQASAYVIVAGGGGGGGSMNGFELNSGGAGGGLIGECAAITPTNGGNNNGKGGTQSAGGAGGTGNVAAGNGGSFDGGDNGNSAPYGGGGGGGFFGGGAGGYNASNVMGGGGGGSGRIHSSVIMGATYTGQSFIPPFFDDPDLAIDTAFRYARGGDEGGHGGHGLVVLYY
jgi:hypothetical protein